MNQAHGDWRDGYEAVLKKMVNAPWTPETDAEILKDTVDTHVHAAAGRVSPLALAKHGTVAGMRAIVLKGLYTITTDAAEVANEAIREWATERNLRPCTLYGAVSLGKVTGGVNPFAVQRALEFGAKIVWLPTMTAVGMLIKQGVPRDQAMAEGDYILRGDSLMPEIKEIVHMAAEYKAAISGGHMTFEEQLAVAEEARRRGASMFVDHPHMGCTDFTFEEIKQLADAGAMISYSFATYHPLFASPRASLRRAVEEIHELGAAKCLLATDSGQNYFASPPESFRMFIRTLLYSGLNPDMLDALTKTNPARLIGLETATS